MRSILSTYEALRVVPARVALSGLLLFALCEKSDAFGQILMTHEPPPSFEVSTVKPSKVDTNNVQQRISRGNFTADHASLKNLLKFAFRIKTDDELLGLPGWAEGTYFDVKAKVDDQTAQDIAKLPLTEMMLQTRLRVQSLLAERFHLVVATRVESRRVYCLTTSKGAPKIREVQTSTGVMADAPKNGEVAPPPPPTSMQGGSLGGGSPLDTSQSDRLVGRAASMDMLTQWLSNRPEVGSRTVLNQTGFGGLYNFSLIGLTPLNMEVSEQADPAHSSIFTLLREQLGLQLELRSAPIQVLVVEAATRPSEN